MQRRYNLKMVSYCATVSTLAISAVFAAVVAPVYAQQSPEASARSQQSAGVEEIIVTARKRQESLLTVPVTETAVPRAQLERMQTLDLVDLQKVVTGLNLGHSSLSVGTLIALRGLGTASTNLGVEQSVSLNIDGLSLGQGLAFTSGLFDLDQIEVLKGPQALFFGKSTTGGVLSLRTADPTDKLEVIGRASYEFQGRTPREEVIISGPVTDTLKLRLASMYSTTEGVFRNVAVAIPSTGALSPSSPRLSPSTNDIVRGTALWDPSSEFSARLKINYVHDRAIAPEDATITSCPEGTNFAPFGIQFIGGQPCHPSTDLRLVYMNPANFPGIMNNGVPFLETTQKYGTLELNYHPTQALTLTSVSAYYLVRATGSANATETSAAAPAIVAENLFRRREITEELRLTSDFRSPLNFTVGAFYEDGKGAEHTITIGNSAYRLPGLLGNSVQPFSITTYSVFGQLRYKITPQLELAGGLRWADEARSETPYNLITGTAIPVPVTVPRIRSDNVSPEFTLTYTPTEDLTIYAAYRQAYKSGGFGISTSPVPNTDNSFHDEKAQGGEVGVKSRWFDRTLSVNIAPYYYHYSGLQVGVNNPAASMNGLFNVLTLNAGAARSYGVDFDTQYRPPSAPGLTLTGAANWNRAKYLVLDNVPCWGGQTIAAGCTESLNPKTNLFTGQNLAGTPLPRAPEWELNFGFNYEFPVGNDYTMTFSNNTSVSSKYVTFIAINRPNNDNYQGGFAKSDLSLTLNAPNGRWNVSLVAKNITDKLTYGYCVPGSYASGSVFGGEITGGTGVGPAGIDQVGCFLEPGRTVWLRVTLKPFG